MLRAGRSVVAGEPTSGGAVGDAEHNSHLPTAEGVALETSQLAGLVHQASQLRQLWWGFRVDGLSAAG